MVQRRAGDLGFLRGAPDISQPRCERVGPPATPKTPGRCVAARPNFHRLKESIEQVVPYRSHDDHAIEDVSLRVAGGEFVCMVGRAAAVNRRFWISFPASPHRIRAACLPMGNSCRVPGGTVW